MQRSLNAVAIFAVLLGGCTRGMQPPNTAQRVQTASEVTRLADDYVREYITRFPEQAELSGLRVERHEGLTDNSLLIRAASAISVAPILLGPNKIGPSVSTYRSAPNRRCSGDERGGADNSNFGQRQSGLYRRQGPLSG